MSRTFATYVASNETGQRNLEAGLNSLVWGWRDSVLERKDHRSIADQIEPGDLIIMGTLGPNPRVPIGQWEGARLGRVLLLRCTSGLYEADTRLWPDETTAVLYPNRVNFEVVYDARLPETAVLDPRTLEALRWSANTQGSPVLVALPPGVSPTFEPEDDTEPEAAANELEHHGSFNSLAHVLVRREQRKIRRQKFGDRDEITCALCGGTYPARLVRAAHVKRRSVCTPDELRDLNNIIPACALGCDELFEHGYLAVSDDGAIIGLRPAHGDLAVAVAAKAGNQCSASDDRSRPYFEWHRQNHG